MPENTKNPLTLLLVRGCLTTECCFLWLSFPEISSAIPDWLRLPTQEDVACSADRLVVIQTSCSPAFFPSWGGWCGVSRTIGVLRRPILGHARPGFLLSARLVAFHPKLSFSVHILPAYNASPSVATTACGLPAVCSTGPLLRLRSGKPLRCGRNNGIGTSICFGDGVFPVFVRFSEVFFQP